MRAACERVHAFLDGIEAYRRHPYRREAERGAVVWREGGTRLLDFGPAEPSSSAALGAPPLLMVPSLVNPAYILDLMPDCSLAGYLAGRGVRTLLLDWGAPGAAERGFGLDDYVARLGRAMDETATIAGPSHSPVALLGYCMGGLLALAAALARPERAAGLALMATPWDFHAEQRERARSAAAVVGPWLPVFDRTGMPVDVIQTLFTALDPMLACRKFAQFAALDPEGEEARRFVALEDWLNDGIPLTGAVARETLVGWYRDNEPGSGAWTVGGRPVRGDAYKGPALALIPDGDRIVPPASALALARALPEAEVRLARTGHIGMIVGHRAEREVWRPLADWTRGLAR